MSELSIQYQPYLDKDYFVENVEFEVINQQGVFLLDRKKSYKLNEIYQNLVLMGQSVQSMINRLKCGEIIEEYQKQYEYETLLIYYVTNCKREEKKIKQSIINQVLNVSGMLILMNKLSDLVGEKRIRTDGFMERGSSFLNQEEQQQINTIYKIYKDVYEELIIKKYIRLKQTINNKASEEQVKKLQDMFKISENESIDLEQRITRFKVCELNQLIVRNKEEELVNCEQKD